MRLTILAALSLTLVAPALCNTHKNTYPVPCNELWAAVKDTLKNSGNYTMIAADEVAMTASYTVGNSLRQRTNSVALNSPGNGCEMQVQSAYRGLAHDDAGDFKMRVEQAMAKLKGSTGVVTEPQGNAVDPKASGVTPEPVKAVSYTHLTLPTNREV